MSRGASGALRRPAGAPGWRWLLGLASVCAAGARADAPLQPVWLDLAIEACEVRAVPPPRDGVAAKAAPFRTTLLTGTVLRTGTLGPPGRGAGPVGAPAAAAPPSPLTLSVPEAPPGFCATHRHTVQRLAYTYACDSGVQPGRCQVPFADATLWPPRD